MASPYMVNGWVMCGVQSACHNIFHAVFYVAQDTATATHKNQTELAWSLSSHIGSKNKKKTAHTIHMNWNNMQHTHTPFLSLFLFLSCTALCLCNALVVLAHACTGSCLLMARCKSRPICAIFLFSVPFFALSHFAPLTGCVVLFSFGCPNVCFAACIGCFVQHIT